MRPCTGVLRIDGQCRLTTQNPHEVWIAIEHKAKAPKMDFPPLRIIRSTGDAMTQGVEQMVLDGVVQVPVTVLAKTIADCFKFRNKTGWMWPSRHLRRHGATGV